MIILSLFLWPFSKIYGAVIWLRHWAYDRGFFASYGFNTPTICVGNLSLGGTGKTPMVELLLRHYNEQSQNNTAVLSRGYGRISKGLVDSTAHVTVEDLGDEPFQIATTFPHNRVVVSASRAAGMNYLEALQSEAPAMVLLDDAMQHRAIRPQFTILLTSFSKPFYSDKLIPAGTLRDLPARAKKADIIVVTKCPRELTQTDRSQILKQFSIMSHQKVVFSYLQYDPVWRGVQGELNEADFVGKEINLLTAIAEPEPLLRYLDQKGIKYRHWKFKDHHFFTANEMEALEKLPNLICTNKDFAKLKDRIESVHYIGVKHAFMESDQATFYESLPRVSS